MNLLSKAMKRRLASGSVKGQDKLIPVPCSLPPMAWIWDEHEIW